MKKYKLKNVFTPATTASLTYVERNSVDRHLNRALNTTGKQVVLYGHSGSGKTTILANKLKNYYSNVITTSCESRMSIDDVLLDAFNQLDIFIKSLVEKTDTANASGGISGGAFGFKANIGGGLSEAQKEIEKRLIDVQLTPQTLADYMGQTEHCWVIEDFHKIKTDEKKHFAQVMKIFMDKATSYEKVKIIAIGAVNSAREVVQYEPEMRNRVSEIFLPLMDYS